MSYREGIVSSWLKMYGRKIVVAIIAIAITIGAWANLLFNLKIKANVETVQSLPLIVTMVGIDSQLKKN